MADDYRELAAKCRSLAERISDPRTIDVLLKLAEEYEAKAEGGHSESPDGNGPLPRPDH